MLTSMNKLTESGCTTEKKEKLCRSRGGESCAFDGAMIVLQPIADTAHIVHGPITCAGNSWEGRGTLSSKGDLHRMGFTTDMNEMDIIYGSEDKLYNAIIETHRAVNPKAIFVYSTCVSGLIGEDIESICRKAEAELNVGAVTSIRVIPVNAPGFVGPKNLGNRIAGEVLLDHVIGTAEPALTTGCDINLIGEYNIAGDQWLIEPVLEAAGIRVLSRITGDSTFEEITHAHRAKLNVVVCSRALINVAKEMQRKYGIPYVEVSFFGKTEMSRALRAIASSLSAQNPQLPVIDDVEAVIARQETMFAGRIEKYRHLRGKRAVLYTGGVKSWSLISALRDLGIEIVAVGTKKSTFEDEQKMRALLGDSAPLVEDVAAKNLLALIHEGKADMLIAGGRNQYLAMKEGIPCVDVNQERHIAYAGYTGLVNLAEQISNSIKFFDHQPNPEVNICGTRNVEVLMKPLKIDPLKHSPSIGAATAIQGVHNALPIIHGAQGCSFLAKVLLTKHFREPISLASTKLFTEDVVMGDEETLAHVIQGFADKNNPDMIAIVSSGLSEVKGDDVSSVIKKGIVTSRSKPAIIHIPTIDYQGGLEDGYAKAVEALLALAVNPLFSVPEQQPAKKQINVLAGSHLTPADFTELREIINSFGLNPVILPDLSCLDGSRQDFTALTSGGTTTGEIMTMGLSSFTLVIGTSLEAPARMLKDKFDIEYEVFESICGLQDTGRLLGLLSNLSEQPIPQKYERQRKILIDGMRDAHFYYGGAKVCLAVESDLAAQTSRWLHEMGAVTEIAVGDLYSISNNDSDYNLLIASSHGEDTAKRLGVPLYQLGFPVYKVLGNTTKITIGYRGTLTLINEVGTLLSHAQPREVTS